MVPKITWRPSKKLSPMMMTVAPPVVHPSLGLIALMQGAAPGEKITAKREEKTKERNKSEHTVGFYMHLKESCWIKSNYPPLPCGISLNKSRLKEKHWFCLNNQSVSMQGREIWLVAPSSPLHLYLIILHATPWDPGCPQDHHIIFVHSAFCSESKTFSAYTLGMSLLLH